MPFSVPRALLALVLAATLNVVVPVPPSAADFPLGGFPIEGFPSYQPQTRCSPKPKPGTLELAKYLQAAYPGSGHSGISRSCGASGVSEHKEGRAFDWRLYAALKKERGYARDFLTRLFADDKAGNPKALARRMGIMYIIWNDQIWSSSDGYQRRKYLHSACRKLTKCSTTLRHRDHMHISLTWAGARGRTSWYVKRGVTTPAPAPQPAPEPAKPAPAPKPQPAPEPEPEPRVSYAPRTDSTGIVDLRDKSVVRVKVPADGAVRSTRFKLRKGTRYTLTVGGLYSYGRPDQSGDAVCTWSRAERAWKPGTRRRLLVNGKEVLGQRCRPATHTYRVKYVAPATRVMRLRIPGRHTSSRGALTLVLSRGGTAAEALPTYQPLTGPPAPVTTARAGHGLLTETVVLDARRRAHTAGGLQPGATYRVTVSGVARLGNGVRTDGRCVSVAGQWYRSASIDLRAPGQEHGRLYLNGVAFDGEPTSGAACEAHSHSGELTADLAGVVRLELWDPLGHENNSGSLTVRFQRVTAFREPGAAKPALPRKNTRWTQRKDEFEVASTARRGTVSTMRLRKGQQVRITVRGTHRSHGRTADATCVRTPGGWVRRDPEHALTQDPLDLWVDGRAVRWKAVGASTPCSADHTYRTRVTATKRGPLRLAVLDLDHADNKGALSVTMVRRTR